MDVAMDRDAGKCPEESENSFMNVQPLNLFGRPCSSKQSERL